MRQYLKCMRFLLKRGHVKEDRTGTGTYSLPGLQMRFELSQGFPLLTTKKVHLKSVIYELLWMLRGDTNIKYLKDHGITIWDEWADENGELGPVYGHQWRSWPTFAFVPGHAEGTEWVPDEYRRGTIDQIAKVVETLKKNPDSRRIIVSAWNPADVDKQALPPCHCLFQFYTHSVDLGGMGKVRVLSCMLHQRSADFFLGVPFNIASYALLTMMVARVTRMLPGEFVWTGGDVHLYSNHLDQARTQLARKPRPLPRMEINPTVTDIFDFKYEDFTLLGYDPHPAIRGDVAV